MINDRKIIIAVGANRKSTNWQSLELNYSEFVEKLRKPTRTIETLDEFLKLPKNKQDTLKDVGGFVGGELLGNRRKAYNVKSRDLITLDFDNVSSGATEDVMKKVMCLGCAYVVYSTRKHARYKPRLRIVLPLDRSVKSDEYEPIARKVATMIGIEMADPTTFEPSRLMYWPSCSRDSEYIFKYEDKPFLSADGVLSQYADWQDITSWPQVPGSDIKVRRLVTEQVDPTTKSGIVGAFCRAYDIYQALEKFVPEAYNSSDIDSRLTYMGGSTSGGAVIYQDGLFLYSHHATDPCSSQLVNSWDLVRLHKFSKLDEEAEEGTPVATLPSFLAMKDLAKTDEKVQALINKDRQDEAKSFFDELGQDSHKSGTADKSKDAEGSDEWLRLLSRDGKGNIDKTIANTVLVISNDLNFRNKIFIDEFANAGMVKCPLPWDSSDETRLWNDFDDAQLALRLEKEYGLTGRDKIENAIKVVGFNNRRNEVKEMIKSFRWDGIERIPTLLRDYLGAEQNIYTEDVMKKSLAAAVSRAMSNKGVKYDYMVVFTGKQGIGKSTFLSKLGMDWFSDSLYNFEGKEAAELIQGTLINEVGELTAMTKSETEAVKQFLSKTHDIYREAYGRRTNKYPRRCVFFGSTNSDEFLKDTTGNRRFWPVEVGINETRKDVFRDLDNEVEQIWAEAYTYYMLGEPLFLSGESDIIANNLQEKFREADPKTGAVVEYLEKSIPSNWYSLSLGEQRAFLNGNLRLDEGEMLVERDKVCVAEIWQVCFGGDLKYMKRRDSNDINGILSCVPGWTKNKSRRRYGFYGTQRGFEKSRVLQFNEIKDRK